VRPRKWNCRSSRAMRVPRGSAIAVRLPAVHAAVYRKFGLARTKLREAANRGEIPGLDEGELVRRAQ